MVTTTDLVSYWKLDESSGDLIDSEGSNDLTNNGATYGATGILNDAMSLDGTNDYFSKSSLSISTSAFSFSIWFNWDGSTSDNRHIIYWNSTSPNQDRISCFIRPDSSSKIRFDLIVDGTNDYMESNSAASSSGWQHLVITWDGTTTKMYVNGSLQTDTGSRTGTFDGTATLAFGRNTDSDNYFDGDFDEIGYWTRALSSTDVSDLYNSGSGLAYPFSAAGTSFQVNIGDVWKDVSAMKINIGDSWKDVAGAQINIGDDWKSIF